MRVVVVSAHYPPDFVSGGTLQPQRLARALRREGHEVAVFAGWNQRPVPVAGNPPSWEERDEEGLLVHWVNTSAWLDPASRANVENPVVATELAGFLGRARPEVVHVHTLQGMGVDVLAVAQGTGARVVLTMHDLWWLCARLFCVDRRLRRCTPVTMAGSCACEAGARWRAAREELLRPALKHVDLVLAPSQAFADLLVANGLAASRIEVDENGVVAPASLRGRRPRDPTEPIRFVFTGGAHPFKGLQVVVEAARLLAERPGWVLDVHASGPPELAELVASIGPAARLLPPYAPARAPEVLGHADVVLLATLGVESFSLVAREALAAGAFVITSDSVGPEELVRDEVDGMVVSTGDAAGLAEAMARVVEDPRLLLGAVERGRERRFRSIEDQAAALARRYAALVGNRAGGSAGRATTGEGPSADASGPVGHEAFATSPEAVVVIGGADPLLPAGVVADALALTGAAVELRQATNRDRWWAGAELIVSGLPVPAAEIAGLAEAARAGVSVVLVLARGAGLAGLSGPERRLLGEGARAMRLCLPDELSGREGWSAPRAPSPAGSRIAPGELAPRERAGGPPAALLLPDVIGVRAARLLERVHRPDGGATASPPGAPGPASAVAWLAGLGPLGGPPGPFAPPPGCSGPGVWGPVDHPVDATEALRSLCAAEILVVWADGVSTEASAAAVALAAAGGTLVVARRACLAAAGVDDGGVAEAVDDAAALPGVLEHLVADLERARRAGARARRLSLVRNSPWRLATRLGAELASLAHGAAR